MKEYILSALLIFSLTSIPEVFAQKPKVLDSTCLQYIEPMNKDFNVKFSINNDLKSIKVIEPQQQIQLEPNNSTLARLSINYRFINLSVSYIPRFIPGNNDDQLKGKSSYFSFGAGTLFKRIVLEGRIQKTSGYYLSNTADVVPGWVKGKDPYILFPELKYWSVDGFVGYKFNNKYSLKSFVTQTERQLRSAGSFFVALYSNYYTIDNDVDLSIYGSSQRTNNIECRVALKYFYTLVLKNNFYVSVGGGPSVGFLHTQLLTRFPSSQIETFDNNALLLTDAIVGLGYNGKKFFAGCYVNGSWQKYNQTSTVSVEDEGLSGQIFIGYRIPAPARLNKLADRLPF